MAGANPEAIHVVLTTLKAAAGQTPPAPPPVNVTDLSLWETMTHSGPISFAALLLLIGFSVTSWAIIVHKLIFLRRAARESERFLVAFWDAKRLDQMYQQSEEYTKSPLAQVFRSGYVELARLKKKSGDDETLGG
ncbi:unnamed protein product, partial [Laminaria digitata]